MARYETLAGTNLFFGGVHAVERLANGDFVPPVTRAGVVRSRLQILHDFSLQEQVLKVKISGYAQCGHN